MESFLTSVAKDLYDKFGKDMHEVCVVFPNRRAGIFFNKILAEFLNKPVWGPNITTITDLMHDLGNLKLADPLTLIFNLFKVYTRHINTNETFDDFYYWGEMLVNDFDEIDKYLVIPEQIFQNLADIKDIDNQFNIPEDKLKIIKQFWSGFKMDKQGLLKENFISIWQKLLIIYKEFNDILLNQKIAYEGMLYKNIVNNLKQTGTFKSYYKHYLIAGFNALNNCEKELFKYLQLNNIADFYWDYDDYYVNNNWHEAGYFMRENLKLFPQAMRIETHNSLTQPKNIEIVSVPSNTGQTKLVNYFIEKWECSVDKMTESAVIMADEQLLLPLLSSIPQKYNKVNVTLGYPLKLTSVAGFFEAVVGIQKNKRRQDEGNILFYHKDIKVLLNHIYIQSICEEQANKILDEITHFNRIFISQDYFQSHTYLKNILRECTSSNDFILYLKEIGILTVNYLNETESKDKGRDFEKEYWFNFILALNRLEDVLFKEKIEPELTTTINIIRKIINGLSVPFKGEPLAGLQVMGILETRAIDFNNVIMLSVNESVMPGTEYTSTFIPYNLRRGFGLPTIEHQDAVYAYYFYRLIQRANNIALIYNSQASGRAGEMSRYIYQLKYDSVYNIKEQNFNVMFSLSQEKNIIIQKTKYIQDILNKYLADYNSDKYITPTALNTYLECSLKFYFRYVAGIHQEDEITENIEGSMFGKLFHYAMNLVYQEYKGKEIKYIDFENLIRDDKFIESCVLMAFAKEFFKSSETGPKLYGNSIIVKEVLIKYIRQILVTDSRLAPFTLIDFEKTYKTIFDFYVSNTLLQINAGGKLDRIDKKGNVLRIVDYKTGRLDYGIKDIGHLFQAEGKNLNKDILQILIYASVLSEDNKFGILPVTASIYGLHDIFRPGFNPNIQIAKNEYLTDIKEIKPSFLKGLQGLFSEIFNPEIPFRKVADKKKCEYCEFKMICHR